MIEQSPRHYAAHIMQLDDKKQRRIAFNQVPEHLKAIVRKHCEITQCQQTRNRRKQ